MYDSRTGKWGGVADVSREIQRGGVPEANKGDEGKWDGL